MTNNVRVSIEVSAASHYVDSAGGSSEGPVTHFTVSGTVLEASDIDLFKDVLNESPSVMEYKPETQRILLDFDARTLNQTMRAKFSLLQKTSSLQLLYTVTEIPNSQGAKVALLTEAWA